jgi:hypothetical protein
VKTIVKTVVNGPDRPRLAARHPSSTAHREGQVNTIRMMRCERGPVVRFHGQASRLAAEIWAAGWSAVGELNANACPVAQDKLVAK